MLLRLYYSDLLVTIDLCALRPRIFHFPINYIEIRQATLGNGKNNNVGVSHAASWVFGTIALMETT